MENIEVWVDEDGAFHVKVDRSGERAVSTEADPFALMRAIAETQNVTVDFTPVADAPIVEPDGPEGTTDTAP